MEHPEQVDLSAPAQNGHASAEQLLAIAELIRKEPDTADVPDWLSTEDRAAVAKILN